MVSSWWNVRVIIVNLIHNCTIWNADNGLHKSRNRLLPAINISTKLNEFSLGPVFRHFQPIQTSWLNYHIILIVFPNLGQFSKLSLFGSIIIKLFCVIVNLSKFQFGFKSVKPIFTCITSNTLKPRLLKHLFIVFVPHFGSEIITYSGNPGYSFFDIFSDWFNKFWKFLCLSRTVW